MLGLEYTRGVAWNPTGLAIGGAAWSLQAEHSFGVVSKMVFGFERASVEDRTERLAEGCGAAGTDLPSLAPAARSTGGPLHPCLKLAGTPRSGHCLAGELFSLQTFPSARVVSR